MENKATNWDGLSQGVMKHAVRTPGRYFMQDQVTSSGHEQMRTLIVGAGIGGLALAIALQRQGMAADVIERAPVLRPVGAGITLGPNAMCVLKQLDLSERILAAGRAMTSGVITDAQGRTLQRLDFGRAIRRLGAPAVALHRARLHEVLLEPVKQQVRLGTPLTSEL